MDIDIEKLTKRIELLEENRRFVQNALETAVSVGDFQYNIRSDDAPSLILEETEKRISHLSPFEQMAIYIVEEGSSDFKMATCRPDKARETMSDEVAFLIEGGFFAWALRENRGLFIPSKDRSHQLLLHVIATTSRIRGMFVGVPRETRGSIPNSSLTLLSLVLLNCANALESIELYGIVRGQNAILEKKVRERTEQLEQQAEALQEANRLKDEFLALIGHELRTPLTPILGWTQLLNDRLNQDLGKEIFQTGLNQIRESSKIFDRLLSDLDDLSQMVFGRLEYKMRTVSIEQVLHLAADQFKPAAEEKEMTIEVVTEGPLAPVRGDLDRLQQVVAALVDNALKFSSAHTTITLHAHNDTGEGMVTASVTDEGAGIPIELRDVIFERFRQAENPLRRKHGGLGLGLAIAKEIIKAHGGTIWLESKPGQGSTFSFNLPAAARAPR